MTLPCTNQTDTLPGRETGLTSGAHLPTIGHTMSHTTGRHTALRESLAPYLGGGSEGGGFEKISISLPAELVAVVREVAQASGQSVSATIAAALRRALDDADQERLDAALALDADENETFSRSVAPVQAELLARLGW
jgi:Arc/MetJ-type ribon-helix-helix transcriptional regulator